MHFLVPTVRPAPLALLDQRVQLALLDLLAHKDP